MGQFFAAVAVAVTAALLERVAMHLARSVWGAIRPAAM